MEEPNSVKELVGYSFSLIETNPAEELLNNIKENEIGIYLIRSNKYLNDNIEENKMGIYLAKFNDYKFYCKVLKKNQ